MSGAEVWEAIADAMLVAGNILAYITILCGAAALVFQLIALITGSRSGIPTTFLALGWILMIMCFVGYYSLYRTGQAVLDFGANFRLDPTDFSQLLVMAFIFLLFGTIMRLLSD